MAIPHDVLVKGVVEGTERALATHARRWVDQSPRTPLNQILAAIRREKADDTFDPKRWDHRNPDYIKGRSNKSVAMWATALTGKALPMPAAFDLLEILAEHPALVKEARP